MKIEIEPIGAGELETLREISIRTFKETFAGTNSEENMREYLEKSLSGEQLRKELDNPGSAFYLARLDGRVIGYLKINFGPAQTELQDNKALELERIYVLQELHGQGPGLQLLDFCLEIAADHSLEYIWLGVWEENRRAIRFYEKHGFRQFGSHLFQLGNDEQTDILMRKEIIG